MTNSIVSSMTAVIIMLIVLCRINTNSHKKNYNKFLSELKNSNNKYENELNMIMKYISKHYEIQEINQFTYIMVIIIALIVIFYNI